MNTIKYLKERLINGGEINKEEAMSLIEVNLEELICYANELRIHFCNNKFDICTIINGKSGKCSEDCKFCAQSTHYNTEMEEYPLLDNDVITRDAIYNKSKGILRYSIVTSGKYLTEDELKHICEVYMKIKKECGISLCVSHGLLNFEQMKKLKESGVTRYHNNLETSRRYFPKVCTTHTYDDKINTIKSAKRAGLEVCCGGIMGLGETIEDRIDMAIDIRSLGIKSVPVNVLIPMLGTPFENHSPLTEDEVKRIVAIYRFIMPYAAIRLAGGRGLFIDKGKSLFISGANAVISGDMLTTAGISIDEDVEIIKELGYEVGML